MLLQKNTKLYQLLTLFGLSGFVSHHAAALLLGKQPAKNMLCRLRREVKIDRVDNTRLRHKKETLVCTRLVASKTRSPFLRLTPNGAHLLSEISAALLEKHQSMTYSGTVSNPKQKKRCALISEMYAMMMRSGVRVQDKPVLCRTVSSPPVLTKQESVFYDSVEFKRMSLVRALGFTRMTGILYCPNGIFVTYTLNKKLAGWVYKDEEKMLGVANRISKFNCSADFACRDGFLGVIRNAAIFGKQTGIMAEMLRLFDTPESSDWMGGGEFYRNRYFIPLDENGIHILTLLASPHADANMVRLLLRRIKGAEAVDDLSVCHVKTKNTYYYLAITNNLDALRKIKSLATHHPKNEYVLFVMDWQCAVLSAYYATLPNVRLFHSQERAIYDSVLKGGCGRDGPQQTQ